MHLSAIEFNIFISPQSLNNGIYGNMVYVQKRTWQIMYQDHCLHLT